MRTISALACMVALALPCRAQEGAPEIRQFDLSTIQKLGRDMYVQDQAAWHATDALQALHPMAEMQTEKVGGWIVEAEGQLVRFIRDGDAGPEAAYDISYASGKPVVSVPKDRHLSGEEMAQFGARSLAIKSITQRCGDNYNTVVLRDPQGDGWLAWALAATSNPNLIMMGGHLRLTVSADGTTIIRRDALSRSCTAINKQGEKDAKQPAGVFTTQLVSDIPVETAVFNSLEHRLPIFIGTPDKSVWAVEGDKIRKLQK